MNSQLELDIQELADAGGADFYGIADLQSVQSIIATDFSEMTAGYPRAIVFGITLMNTIVDQIIHQEDRSVLLAYRHHAYDVVNLRLDNIASRMGSMLQANGWRAYPVPARVTFDNERQYSIFSHKMAARLAGLGWIGKNCLLITPQNGPRVRWASVLTNAPLEASREPLPNRCGTCRQCVEICPVNAIMGRQFDLEEPRQVRLDAFKCNAHQKSMEAKHGMPVNCGLCLFVCPYGRESSYSSN